MYNDNWTWRQIVMLLKDEQNIILKMESNMQGLQKPHIGMWCWTNEFWKRRKDLQGRSHFYHNKWYGVKYGWGVFIEGTIIDNNLHGEKYSWLLIQMSGYNILFNYNLWFKIIKIKLEQDLLQFLISQREYQVQSRWLAEEGML